MLAIVILAAGESSRMGQPKALIPFPKNFLSQQTSGTGSRPAVQASGRARTASTREKTFLCHLIEATRHPRAGALCVVVGAHAEEIRARAKLDTGELVVNEDWRRGQLSSLQAAIRTLPTDAEGLVLCLVDHPLISAKLVASLIAAFDRTKRNIVLPLFHGRRGHPVIFPRRLFAELLAAPEEVGARAVVRAHAGEVTEVPTEEEGVTLNLNDPAALQKILNRR